jgi:hypothetical protein
VDSFDSGLDALQTPITEGRDGVPLTREEIFDQVRDVSIVIHDEDMCCRLSHDSAPMAIFTGGVRIAVQRPRQTSIGPSLSAVE